MEEKKTEVQNVSNNDSHRANNVANGASKKKSKSFIQKLIETIIPSDVTSIKDYLILDVFIPTVKRSIVDAVNLAVFGEVSGRNASSRVPAQKVSWRTDYHGMSQSPRTTESKRYATYDYDTIIFETKGAAEAVLSELDDVMERYRVVSVLDLYDAAGLDCDHTANDWGWYDIRTAEAVRTFDGDYVIKMPKARPLKDLNIK